MNKARPSHDYSRTDAPRSHTVRVMRDIGMAIVAGRYGQGTILPGDAELTAKFGVSRTVLREAMKTLDGKGLLQSRARIGTRVRDRSEWNLFDPDVLIWHAEAGFDAAFLTHVGEMRLALEPEAAALAAERRTPAQLQALYGWVEQMGAPNVTAQQFVDADLNLHLAVSAAAANPFFTSISTLIEVALVAALARSSPVNEPSGAKRSAADHRAIVDAIAHQDPVAARAAMRVVIEEGVARTASGATQK